MNPIVSIIMGSDSDLQVMAKAAKMLEDFGVPYEMSVISAHRTADKMCEYAKGAKARGIKVIIAGAGWAAALPSMVAAMTTLPVIGVPIYSKYFGGQDALYSTVMTPPGVPVATVAIDGAANAALLAIRMLGIEDDGLTEKIAAYSDQMRETVEKKAAKLEEVKYEAYLADQKK
ncbi:5-(carboxyamino)imidazole ribonucleotide mutase [Lachnotalea sp. AF33-28]|jgi:5-(carboxyamino)imidazole ribonucleotide mutase|uniref:5-(carboxyamino)imidazole ribonucleotide mutase n=1 Tax=Lachnotalea sp. AF33-28 TaxID=2292046 RepID=UPI000E547E8B|nr:5-(carboxyamino)imidazole ribonucleotide mutase [Lachnotalea sp. AF33-28]RHP34567.1 5-(carboxyamino)imidazole ribonucleotide mutase [Lachnotalea sp. AF33-28]